IGCARWTWEPRDGCAPAGGGQRPRSVLERGRSGNQDDNRSPCITWKNSLTASSDVEALAATAFTLGLGVLKLEGLVQALLDEIHGGAVDQRQAGRIDHHFDPPGVENGILGIDCVSIINDIRETR